MASSCIQSCRGLLRFAAKVTDCTCAKVTRGRRREAAPRGATLEPGHRSHPFSVPLPTTAPNDRAAWRSGQVHLAADLAKACSVRAYHCAKLSFARSPWRRGRQEACWSRLGSGLPLRQIVSAHRSSSASPSAAFRPLRGGPKYAIALRCVVGWFDYFLQPAPPSSNRQMLQVSRCFLLSQIRGFS
jgi:hypothetical protein